MDILWFCSCCDVMLWVNGHYVVILSWCCWPHCELMEVMFGVVDSKKWLIVNGEKNVLTHFPWFRQCQWQWNKWFKKGGSPGLVVMGGDSCSKDCEFESWHPIYWMDIFSHLFVVKIVMYVWKDENKWKRGRGWPI